MLKNITIKENNAKQRIDKFLSEEFPEYSRSFWQKMIKDDLVLVKNKKVRSHYKLEAGDKIKITKKDSIGFINFSIFCCILVVISTFKMAMTLLF